MPEAARTQPANGEDEYEGWLWKSLTGRGASASASNNGSAPAPEMARKPLPDTPTDTPPSAVQQTSYSSTAPSGQLIPGPATPGAETIPSPLSGDFDSAITAFGPPPTIPKELPSPPPGAISLRNADKEKAEKKGFEFADLAPDNLWKNFKVAIGQGPNEKIARENYEEGKKLFGEGRELLAAGKTKEGQEKFRLAVPKFAKAADRWPDTPLEEDALFLQADSEFFSDQYPKAHDTYGGLLKKYANTRFLDTVMRREFALGRYWEQLQTAKPMWTIQPNVTDRSRPYFDTFGYAVQAFERIRAYDPTGPLADDSVMALGNAYFRYGQFENAAYNYDLLRKEYPNSKHQMNAHLFDLQAKMRVYQGTLYDGNALKDAEKIADQTLKLFGDKLGDERAHVAEARRQIIEEKANREFVRADYYEKHQYYGAARLYYKNVIDKFPSTDKAKEALARYEKIRDKPAMPTNHFKWLTDVVDSKK